MDTRSRLEHLEWCKQRALDYVDTGALTKVFESLSSDLGKHPDTANHPAIETGLLLLMQGRLNTPEKMRSFITGFN